MSNGSRFHDLLSGVDPETWPAPLSLGPDLPPAPRLDPALLPEALRPWLSDIADRMQAPLEFPATAAIVAAGAAIGRRCGLKPQAHTDWTEVPNIWGALVGRPAMMKSPSLKAALAPMARLEGLAAGDNAKALKRHARDMQSFTIRQKAEAEVAKARLKKAVQTGADGSGVLMNTPDPPDPPRLIRYILADATYEKAGEILADNPAGILVVRDELVGFLKPLGREENAAARAFWLETWNGSGGYTFDRIVRGTVRLEACCASVIGGIQPGKLAAYLKDAIAGGAGDDGLMQRFGMLVYPDPSPDWRNVDRPADTAARRAAEAVFTRLARLDAAAIRAEAEPFDAFPSLRFSKGALRLFEAWREGLETRLRGGDLHPALESHFAKYRKLAPALALIFHLVDSETGGPVSAGAFERARAWLKFLESHAYRTYASVSQPERAGARTILAHLQRGDIPAAFAVREVQQKGWTGLSTAEAVRAALEVLEAHAVVRVERVPHAVTGGRPAERWTVNPGALALPLL